MELKFKKGDLVQGADYIGIVTACDYKEEKTTIGWFIPDRDKPLMFTYNGLSISQLPIIAKSPGK